MEEELKQLLGENYHEGMTAAEVQDYFKKQVLSTGEYVSKGKSEAETNKLKDELKKAKEALESKLTDDEKKLESEKAKDDLIKQLQETLSKNTLSTNSYKALGITTEARLHADIKDDDEEFGKFIDNITSDNEEKTKSISNYVNKLVKAAYEKGKADMTKDKMAKMGTFKKNENNNDGGQEESRATRLAKQNFGAPQKNSYFKL